MPLAEESGVSSEIGAWVLDRALADQRDWHDDGRDVVIAVNLSARQLQQPDLVEEVAAALTRHGTDPAHLRLEITEPTLMQDSELMSRAVLGLRALGAEIAIDN